MQGKLHSLAAMGIWQDFHTGGCAVSRDSRAEPVPCHVLASWILLGWLQEILESFESKIIRGAFQHHHLQQQK